MLHLIVQYLLILVSRDGRELGFRERETMHTFGGQRLDLREVNSGVMLDDVDPRLVLVHRLQNYL